MVTYPIKIFDNKGLLIGELMTATPTEVMKFINKGCVVVDQNTNKELTVESVAAATGVSDGLINIG